MPAVYEALAERDVIRSTIYSGSTGLPDVAIKPEYKGRHHSIARQLAMGPLSGFVAGSSSWSSRPPAFARQVARSHRGWVRFTPGSRSFPGSRRPATWLPFPSETISSPAFSSWAWGPWSPCLRSWGTLGPPIISSGYWTDESALGTFDHHEAGRVTSDRAKVSRADVEHLSMARRNRAEVVVADEVGVYHCVQRVVRRAFLCGVDPLSDKSYDHRRSWIRDRLESLAGFFGVEIAAFAVMSNHLHVILRNRPDVVALWSDQEVARRWLTLFPGRVGTKPDPTSVLALAGFPAPTAEQARSISPGTPAMPPGREPTDPLEQAVGVLTTDPALMATIRGRLSSLSWFMRALAEPIARRANREDKRRATLWRRAVAPRRLAQSDRAG